MSDPIDVSGDTRTNWDAEIEGGHLMRQDPSRTNRASKGEHVQGIPVNDGNRRDRSISASKAKDMLDQAASGATAYRPPPPSAGKISASAPKGGWPKFGPDGSIVREPHL